MKHATLPALALVLLFCGAGGAAAEDYAIGPMRLSHLWAPATAESAKDAPGFLTVTNTGSAPDRLQGGSFIEADHIEIVAPAQPGSRTVAAVDGGVTIAPGQTLVLKPGAEHLMFVGLRSPLRPGASEQAILHFEKAGSGAVAFAVENAPGRSRSAGKHGHAQAK